MSTAFEDIGVLTHLSLAEAKNSYESAKTGISWDDESTAAATYIEQLEQVLEHLGIKISEDGTVTATEGTP